MGLGTAGMTGTANRYGLNAGGLLDRLGIGLSGLCLVHCLGLPLVITAAPAN